MNLSNVMGLTIHKARELLHESPQISTKLGMRPPMERVQSRREILKALRTVGERFVVDQQSIRFGVISRTL